MRTNQISGQVKALVNGELREADVTITLNYSPLNLQALFSVQVRIDEKDYVFFVSFYPNTVNRVGLSYQTLRSIPRMNLSPADILWHDTPAMRTSVRSLLTRSIIAFMERFDIGMNYNEITPLSEYFVPRVWQQIRAHYIFARDWDLGLSCAVATPKRDGLRIFKSFSEWFKRLWRGDLFIKSSRHD